MITRDDAQDILHRHNARRNFFTLDSGTVEGLLYEADRLKYRKPRNANGSRGRYFHAYLIRCANKED